MEGFIVAVFTGKMSHASASEGSRSLLLPLGAHDILSSEPPKEQHSAVDEKAMQRLALETPPASAHPALVAAHAVASAEAAAAAAAAATKVAAATLREKREESDSSTSSSVSSQPESSLLSGVRASRAFKVVPSQIKDLLDANTHAFRVTPKKGIESALPCVLLSS